MKCLSEQKYAISFIFIKKKSTVNAQVERCFFGGPGNCYTHTRLAMPNLVSIYADFEILDGWMPFRLKKYGPKIIFGHKFKLFLTSIQ